MSQWCKAHNLQNAEKFVIRWRVDTTEFESQKHKVYFTKSSYALILFGVYKRRNNAFAQMKAEKQDLSGWFDEWSSTSGLWFSEENTIIM